MTREEAINQLNFMMEIMPKEPPLECDGAKEWMDADKDIRTTLKMAIEALKQKSCEDAISRQAVLDTLDKMDSVLDENRTVETYKELLATCYNDLPPVTPTHKKGYWINKSHKSGCGITFIASECTCCGKKTFFDCDELIYRFCPNCGAEMVVTDEN